MVDTTKTFPDEGWIVEDGALKCVARGRAAILFTIRSLVISNSPLSGKFLKAETVVFLFLPGDSRSADLYVGPEFQILDNDNHPDAKAGRMVTYSLFIV